MANFIEQTVQEARVGNVVEVSFEMPPSSTIRTMVAYFREYGFSPRPGTCRLAYEPAQNEQGRGIFVCTEINRWGGVFREGQSDLYIPIKAIKDFSILRK